jgi:hypothetical protein
MRAWILYTALRVGLFVVLTAILYAVLVRFMGTTLLAGAAAAAVAALLSFCVSYIFLGRLRARVASEFAARRGARPASSDEDAEDAAIAPSDQKR